MPAARLAIAALAATLASCGRSQLRVPRTEASEVTPTTDAALDVPPDVVTSPCHWLARPRVAITDTTEDHALEALISDANAVLIGWQISDADPPHDRTWRLQRFGFDGSRIGDPQGPLGTPAYGIGYGGISPAFGTMRDGAIAWDETRGCRFVPITVDGAVNGSNVTVATEVCSSLVAYSDGFTFLVEHATPEGSQWTLTSIGTEGQLVRSGVPITPSGMHGYAVRRVVLADGTFMAFWTDGLTSAELHARRFSAQGDVMGDDQIVAHLSVANFLGRPTLVGSNVAMAWVDHDGAGVARVQLVLLDSSGRTLATALVADATNVFPVAGVALAFTHGALLASWGEGDEMRATAVRAQPFDSSLAPTEAAFDLDHFNFGGNVHMVPSPDGALAVYEAEPSAVPMQIEAVPISCAP